MTTVLQVAYPFSSVSPDAVGGAEQVLSMIDAALVRRGHRSFVIAAEGSTTHGKLVQIPRHEGPIDRAAWARAHRAIAQAITMALAEYQPDVVHLHGVDFHAYVPKTRVPILVTLHLPPSFYPDHALTTQPSNVHLQCVSRTQERALPKGARVLPPIPNGVDIERLKPSAERGDHLLAMGRMCPEKAFHDAIDAAWIADAKLLLAGAVFEYEEHRRYFEHEIERRVREGRATFIGAIAGEEKARLLASARALLVPSVVAETSSLVAMEALACGTPVIARRIGALPDIVDDGVTGILVNDIGSMARAIGRIDTLDRAACRRAAEERFSREAMTEAYLALYQRLA